MADINKGELLESLGNELKDELSATIALFLEQKGHHLPKKEDTFLLTGMAISLLIVEMADKYHPDLLGGVMEYVIRLEAAAEELARFDLKLREANTSSRFN